MNTKKLKVALPLLSMVILSARFCSAAGPQNDDLHQEKIENLISRINELGYYQEPSKEIRNDPNKIKDYWPQQHRKRAKYKAQREKIQAELATMGDDAVDPILRQKGRYGNEFYIPVLAEIGTPRAMEALRQKTIQGNSLAARYYTRKLKDKTKAKGLLDSKDINVQRVALNALRGTAIDSDFLALLNKYLSNSEHLNLQRSAARVIADDPNSTFAEQKVSALIKTIDSVAQLPRAWEKYQYDWTGCLADIQYRFLTDALVKMKGADAPLRDISDKVNGLTRDCVIVARANRGDVSVKPQVYKFIRDPNAMNLIHMRQLAVGSFAHIGDNGDIEFLQDIAKDDSVEIVNLGGPMVELINGQLMFPSDTVPDIQFYSVDTKRWSRARSHSMFPIRKKAKKTIQFIEEKQKKEHRRKDFKPMGQ